MPIPVRFNTAWSFHPLFLTFQSLADIKFLHPTRHCLSNNQSYLYRFLILHTSRRRISNNPERTQPRLCLPFLLPADTRQMASVRPPGSQLRPWPDPPPHTHPTATHTARLDSWPRTRANENTLFSWRRGETRPCFDWTADSELCLKSFICWRYSNETVMPIWLLENESFCHTLKKTLLGVWCGGGFFKMRILCFWKTPRSRNMMTQCHVCVHWTSSSFDY